MSSTLDELPPGSRVAVDANILVYHFTATSVACRRFVERCERGEFEAVMPAHIALEVLHRRMMIEAVDRGIVTSGNIARKLGERPERVRSLAQCHADFRALDSMGIRIVPTTSQAIARVSTLCLTYGLLANDAALVAVMEEEGIKRLATADSHLSVVSLMETYLPGDL